MSVLDFVDQQKVLYSDLVESYDNFGNLYQRKLWHQLSEALYEFLSNINNCRGESFHDLYSGFIQDFESKLNPISFVQLASLIGPSLSDLQISTQFYVSLLENRKRLGPEASMVLDMEVVLLKLKLGENAEAKMMLEESKEKLSSISTTERVVFSKYFKAETEYRKVVGPPQEFYKAALMYLVYTPLETLNKEEQYILATDVALAALTADGVFNFGEVISIPLLDALKDTPNAWMKELFFAMHKGSIQEFNAVVEAKKDAYFAQPALASRHDVVKQKLVMLALINLAFEIHPHERNIAFSVIAQGCSIPMDQVEWMLMRAMSLKLIEGVIDEVAKTVNVTWVLPRVLDMDQINLLGSQVDGWSTKVKDMLRNIEDQTPDL